MERCRQDTEELFPPLVSSLVAELNSRSEVLYFLSRYWWTSQPGYRVSCALYLPEEDPKANWNKVSCEMKNRYICEMKPLIKL